VLNDLFVTECRCLLCGATMPMQETAEHKIRHGRLQRYGLMWPTKFEIFPATRRWKVPTFRSPYLAHVLGVREVYVRDEGSAPSGSMKDYGVHRVVLEGRRFGAQAYSVVSSGNHAVSLGFAARGANANAVIFAPASSSKLSLLGTLPGTLAIGFDGAIFEDVYNLVVQITFEGIWNVNVNNENVMPAFATVGMEIADLDPLPTHILSGVGNGTYLAGIGLGLRCVVKDQLHLPRVIPVGMSGAFPAEIAFLRGELVHEYQNFAVPEESIDAAEGSIATESYSMPQLMESVRITDGFTLGNMTNEDIAEAYEALTHDKEALRHGSIPEPTGIMSLAAALKWRDRFDPDDVLLLTFSGHGIKDRKGINRLVPKKADKLLKIANHSRPDLNIKSRRKKVEIGNSVVIVPKNIGSTELQEMVRRGLSELSQRRDK